jgi:hypothetical protein
MWSRTTPHVCIKWQYALLHYHVIRTLSNACIKDLFNINLHIKEPFNTLRFLVSQKRFHPVVRPFVLSYSVTQALVACNHLKV